MTSPTTDRRQGLVGNTAMKAPVTVLAASNITLSGQQTIDSVAVLATNSAGVPDRVLCVGQTNAVENGIWDVSTAAWSRSRDANGNYDFAQGTTVLVNQGTVYGGSYWKISTSGQLTIGSSVLAWARALASSISTLSFLQSGTGAVARAAQDKMRDIVDVRDFGVVVDSAGAAAANYAAITAALATGAKKIQFPQGLIYVSDTVSVNRPVFLEGVGSQRGFPLEDRTVWRVPTGKTAIRVEQGPVFYGDNSIIQGLTFTGTSKNATSTTGSISAASKSLALAAAQDFATGQLVLVRGAGAPHILNPSWYISAATTAASPTVTMSGVTGVHPGMVLQVAGAGFPAGTYVLSRVGAVLTMSANAVSTVAAGQITVYQDLVALVQSGGGTTTLTLNEAAETAVTSAVVEHYDCAVYSRATIKLYNCRGTVFSGATLYLHAGGGIDNANGGPTNANVSVMRDVHGDNCRNVIRIRGADSNACGIYDSTSISSVTEYGFLDYSFLGNYYSSCHVSGGYGYMVVGSGNSSALAGCYREGGTYNSFASKALVLGGNMGSLVGAGEGGSAVLNSSDLLITQAIKPFSSSWPGPTATFGQAVGSEAVWSIEATYYGAGDFAIPFKRSGPGDGVSGLWGHYILGTNTKAGILWSDSGHPSGAGHAFFRNGVNIGIGTGSLSTGNFRRQIYGTSPPSSGTLGDIVWSNVGSSGLPAAWYCTASSTSAATWRVMAFITTATS